MSRKDGKPRILPQPLTLDPFPYVGTYGSRHAYPGTLNGERLTFDPRDGYSQNPEDYA